MDPDAGEVPRGDVDVQLHAVPGAPAQHPLPWRDRSRAGRDVERHTRRDGTHDRRSARGASAAARVRGGAEGVAADARSRGARAGAMTAPRVVATDLDGTIVRSDGTISPRPRGALTAAESAGAMVVIVTGRPPRWLQGIADETGHRGLAICANGALVYDLHTEQV